MYAVVLAGGGGTRLWPLSRRARPKPFLPLLGEQSLFERTLARLTGLVEDADIHVVAEARQLPLAAAQAPRLRAEQLIAEPRGRNTAAAVALAALAIERAGDEVMAVLPADQLVEDDAGFRAALAAAAQAAGDGSLVTLGVPPFAPETGYGYVLGKAGGAGPGGALAVERFVEKPSREIASELLEWPAGAWWNAGIFVWRRDALLAALERHAPDVIEPLRGGLADGTPLADIYEQLPQTSIDYALLEPAAQAGQVKVVPIDVGWTDLGSWGALHAQLTAADLPTDRGVVAVGHHRDLDSRDVLVHSTTGRLVVTVGLTGTIIVDTPDVLLVCDADRAQDIRRIVEQLAEAKETDYL
jgi:mannose-1-phosphate guanylyltransferase/mannose-6-phosphate isomerase